MNILKTSTLLLLAFLQASTAHAWSLWPFGSDESNQPKKMNPFNGLTARAAELRDLRNKFYAQYKTPFTAMTKKEEERYYKYIRDTELYEFNQEILETVPLLSKEDQTKTAHFLLSAETGEYDSFKRTPFLAPKIFSFLLEKLSKPDAITFAEKFIHSKTRFSVNDNNNWIDEKIDTEIFKKIFEIASIEFQIKYAQEMIDNPGTKNEKFTEFFKNIIQHAQTSH